MTSIVEYNVCTGHREILATVDDDQAPVWLALLDDHSTDHVVYARKDDDE